jgi:hypothetical protein
MGDRFRDKDRNRDKGREKDKVKYKTTQGKARQDKTAQHKAR